MFFFQKSDIGQDRYLNAHAIFPEILDGQTQVREKVSDGVLDFFPIISEGSCLRNFALLERKKSFRITKDLEMASEKRLFNRIRGMSL